MGNLNIHCCPSTQYDINRCGLPIYHVSIPQCDCGHYCDNHHECHYNGFGINPDWRRIYYHNCYLDNQYGNHCGISNISFSKDSVTDVIVGNIGFVIAILNPCDSDNDCSWEYDNSVIKAINDKGNTFTFMAISVNKYGEPNPTTITCRSKKNPDICNSIVINVYDYAESITIAFQKQFSYVNYQKTLEFTPVVNLVSGEHLTDDNNIITVKIIDGEDYATLSKSDNGVYTIYNNNNSDSNQSVTIQVMSNIYSQNKSMIYKNYIFELRNKANSTEESDDVYMANTKYNTADHTFTYYMTNNVINTNSIANEFDFYKK